MAPKELKTILVSGANKGIGYEAVRILSEKLPKATIYLGSRSVDNGTKAIQKMKTGNSTHNYDNIKVLQLDVTSSDSIQKAVADIKKNHGTLDVLINNSGIATVNGESVHKDILDVNVDGVNRSVEAFLPILSTGASIITVSSEVGSWATYAMDTKLQGLLLSKEPQPYSFYESLMKDYLSASPSYQWPAPSKTFGTYGISKAILSAYVRSLAAVHPEYTIVNVTPGYCATDLNNNSGPRTAAVGGESCIYPVFNNVKNGELYLDGKTHSWCCASTM